MSLLKPVRVIGVSGSSILDRDDFCAALDSTPIQEADAIIVLRNWDEQITDERMEHAIKLLFQRVAPVLVMTYDEHTKAEANRIFELSMQAGWGSIILVTHRSHHYRAWLTFAKTFDSCVPGEGLLINLYSSPVESLWDPMEFLKIEEYQERGDVATYEEGVQWLR